jgi:hypothetical protein
MMGRMAANDADLLVLAAFNAHDQNRTVML